MSKEVASCTEPMTPGIINSFFTANYKVSILLHVYESHVVRYFNNTTVVMGQFLKADGSSKPS